jgi:hypothetical protein
MIEVTEVTVSIDIVEGMEIIESTAFFDPKP